MHSNMAALIEREREYKREKRDGERCRKGQRQKEGEG